MFLKACRHILFEETVHYRRDSFLVFVLWNEQLSKKCHQHIESKNKIQFEYDDILKEVFIDTNFIHGKCWLVISDIERSISSFFFQPMNQNIDNYLFFKITKFQMYLDFCFTISLELTNSLSQKSSRFRFPQFQRFNIFFRSTSVKLSMVEIKKVRF